MSLINVNWWWGSLGQSWASTFDRKELTWVGCRCSMVIALTPQDMILSALGSFTLITLKHIICLLRMGASIQARFTREGLFDVGSMQKCEMLIWRLTSLIGTMRFKAEGERAQSKLHYVLWGWGITQSEAHLNKKSWQWRSRAHIHLASDICILHFPFPSFHTCTSVNERGEIL